MQNKSWGMKSFLIENRFHDASKIKLRIISAVEVVSGTRFNNGKKNQLTGFLKSSNMALSVFWRASLRSPDRKNKLFKHSCCL